MKVVFGQVRNEVDVDWMPPLWPAYLKAFAEQYVEADWWTADTPDVVRLIEPDVLALSVHSQDVGEITRWLAAGWNVNARIIIGGHHVTALGIDPPAGAEYEAVRGPGEAAFASILAGRTIPEPEHLDDLPTPDHTFGLRKGQKPYLITSRGCPFSCSFCSPKTMWERVQFHSPRRVVDEIRDIAADFPELKKLTIFDDLFAADRRRVAQIATLLRNEGVRLKYNAGMRAELVTHANAYLWSRMGLNRIGIGGESGNDEILKRLKGPSASVARNQRALDVLQEYAIAAGTGIIFGHWAEREQDIVATYEWLLDNYRCGKLMAHSVNILTPMPGTRTWADAAHLGLIDEPFSDWRRLRYLSMAANNAGSRGAWMNLRRGNDSIYLNEGRVPQETLYQMIDYYEKKIAWSSPQQVWRRGKQWAANIVRKGTG